MKPIDIARVCHEANRAYCISIGDHSQLTWEHAEQWQRGSAVVGVMFALAHPECTSRQMHQSWCEQKASDGWVYGKTKNEALKQHPCLVPYGELPIEQSVKDEIFRSIVVAMKPLLDGSSHE